MLCWYFYYVVEVVNFILFDREVATRLDLKEDETGLGAISPFSLPSYHTRSQPNQSQIPNPDTLPNKPERMVSREDALWRMLSREDAL